MNEFTFVGLTLIALGIGLLYAGRKVNSESKARSIELANLKTELDLIKSMSIRKPTVIYEQGNSWYHDAFARRSYNKDGLLIRWELLGEKTVFKTEMDTLPVKQMSGVYVSKDGKTMPIEKWAEEMGVCVATIWGMLYSKTFFKKK